ncbi:MAG: T9SS type A sorting domain-containing protein, partial [Elusimicrobiota bacterium]|nr:T9SS type A sorting domain-containing protein [Elusimicrobiota bacterium]
AGGVGSKTISIFVTNRTDDYLAAKGVKWIIPMGGGLEKSGEVDYPNSEWGQEWTGSVIAPGPAMGELTNSGEMLLLEVLSRGIAVTPETNIKFSLLGCKGGASVQTIGGYFGDTCSDASNGRLLGVNIIAYDSDNNMLAKAAETIYDYRKGETLIKYVWNSTWENYDIIIEDNADFKPEDGIIKTEIKPWELIQGKGADMTQISKWLISISCINYFWEGGMDVWADVSPVYFQYGIEGLNFDTAKSDSQEFGQITGPSSVSFNRTPKVTGSVSSTGGNIVGVWGRYASGEVSEWLITDAADGDFDSEYEGFIFTVPEELEAGEHFIELKSLNAQGEKDAVYSKVNFTVSASSSVLGDINAYVWPNPAKGVNLTIKVDCGIGNANVNLRIYTIAGELVFEKDISNYYNSAKGAYEYEWNTAGKASGVYVYLITAGQGEKTFRKTGKMAVIK